MERYEVEDDGSLTPLIAAAARGDDVVVTQNGEVVATVVPATAGSARLLTRDGKEPASGIDMEALRRLHALLPVSARGGGAALIREMRDMGY